MAVADRIHLYKAQALRSVSARPGRRMSHNPPQPSALDIYDRVGVIVMNENRNFADTPAVVADHADLVRRDRNHPSVVIWSYCNEVRPMHIFSASV
jgi:beta-galactosidase/beta-glucuronidase